MEKSIIAKIDYTKSNKFKKFNKSIEKYIKKNKNKKILHIIDYIYPLKKFKSKKVRIKDHVNLSGFNPLTGPQFIALTGVYKTKEGIIVAGFKDGVHPNEKEKKVLLKQNIKAYSYNIVPTTIFASSMGLKINATGIIKNH